MEWAPKVRVNAVSAGHRRAPSSSSDYYGDPRARAGWRPPSRWAGWPSPADVGDAVAFLASPLAAYVTGANLVVHGGGEKLAFFDLMT